MGIVITEGVFRKKGRLEDINLLKSLRRKMVTVDKREEKTIEDIQEIFNEINKQQNFS
jgi:hypothetical protein